MSRELDDVDERILRELQADARVPNAELARRVALSPPATLERVRRLERLGLILGYHARLDRAKAGFGLTAFVMVSLELRQERPIERFRRAIGPAPEVLECHNVSGGFDFLLKVVARDMRHYEAFVRERLSQVQGVARIQTCFALSTAKETPLLPLGP
jgi:Lrp/AsnC family leucine-responsive transcriptional regulator